MARLSIAADTVHDMLDTFVNICQSVHYLFESVITVGGRSFNKRLNH